MVATGETTITPFHTVTITAKYTGRIYPYATHVATVLSRRLRHLQGGPALVEFNDHRVCYLALTNTAPYSVTIGRNEFIGELDQWTNVDDPRPLDQDIVTKFINKQETKAQKLVNPSNGTKALSDQEIHDKANLNVPDQFKKGYLQLLQKYRKVISVSKTILRRCKTYKHRLYLKEGSASVPKKFPLKPDHQTFVEQSLQEWLRLGVVRRTKSSYNSPIFCVPKKGGGGLLSSKIQRTQRKDPHGQILNERSQGVHQ